MSRLILWVFMGVVALTALGCGTSSDGCCTAGSTARVSGRSLEEEVALTVYGPNSSGNLVSAYSAEDITRMSIVRPSPRVAQRLQAQAAAAAPSPYRYTLASSSGGSIFVDDVMRVYHNGSEIFYGPGPGYNSGSFAPVPIENVYVGDKIRIVATDLYPQCKAMSPLTLLRQDGKSVVVNATGIPSPAAGRRESSLTRKSRSSLSPHLESELRT